jgi:plasmid stabilization system protein ParE
MALKVIWTETALKDLERIATYLAKHWTIREIHQFREKLSSTEARRLDNPKQFPLAKPPYRKALVDKHNWLIYRYSGKQISIMSL